MHKLFEVVVPVLVSLFLIQLMSDVLYVRAIGYQPAGWAAAPTPSTAAPARRIHEVDREASAGAIIT